MDIKELKIEDWVILDKKCYQIDAIYSNGAIRLKEFEYLRFENDLQPIPITEELLEKIGFIRVANQYIYSRKNCNYRISVARINTKEFDGFYFSIYDKTIEMKISYKLINNFHQLQHEIYDAGIDVKIEL